jgi:hypothetical protein
MSDPAPGDKPASPRSPSADWERVEADYRAGILSVREIAAAQGISHTAVMKRAKAAGWERDLRARIEAKAEALVAKQAAAVVSTEVAVATEKAIVDANAQVVADVRLRHRKDLVRAHGVAAKMLAELEGQTDEPGLIEQVKEALAASDSDQRRLQEAWQRVMSLPARVDTLKKLADAMRILIDKEREAYGMESKGGNLGEGTFQVIVQKFSEAA